MHSLLDRLLQFFAWRPNRLPLTDRALAILRDRFGPCPICGGTLHGHEVAKLASVFADGETVGALELERLVVLHQWERATAYQDWDSDRRVREYYLLQCRKKAGLALIRLFSTPEMWADDVVEAGEIMSEEDQAALLPVAGERWLAL